MFLIFRFQRAASSERDPGKGGHGIHCPAPLSPRCIYFVKNELTKHSEKYAKKLTNCTMLHFRKFITKYNFVVCEIRGAIDGFKDLPWARGVVYQARLSEQDDA